MSFYGFQEAFGVSFGLLGGHALVGKLVEGDRPGADFEEVSRWRGVGRSEDGAQTGASLRAGVLLGLPYRFLMVFER